MIKKLTNFISFAAVTFMASLIKFSFASTTKILTFSCFLAVAPVAGTLFNLPTTILLTLTAIFFKTGLKLYAITFGLPTLVATLCMFYQNQNGRFAKIATFGLTVLLPLSCMTFFVWSQANMGAFVYSLYWLIPIVLYFTKQNNSVFKMFSTSLSTTLVAHAVGSLMWTFTIPMTSEQWFALIPVVAIERFFLAIVMTSALITIKFLAQKKAPHFQQRLFEI